MISRATCPSGLTALTVNDEYGDVDAILYMLTGKGSDYAQLKRVAEGLRQRLLKADGVAKIDLYGLQDERIFVEFGHAKLATLGLTPQTLFEAPRQAERGCAGGLRRNGRTARPAAGHGRGSDEHLARSRKLRSRRMAGRFGWATSPP